MYLKTTLLLSAALVAAVPATDDVTPDTTLSQEIDVNGRPISLMARTPGSEILDAARPLLKIIDADTHLVIQRRADGSGALYLEKGAPIRSCDPPRDPPWPENDVGNIDEVYPEKLPPAEPEADDMVVMESRELTQGGPSQRDIVRMGRKLEVGTHVVIDRPMKGLISYGLNPGRPTEECRKGLPPAECKPDGLAARDAEAQGCKARCLAKYGPLLGRRCMKKCKD